MSYYGRRYLEGYNSEQLEYPGYDSGWVLGVQTSASPYVHDRSYTSGRYYDSRYHNSRYDNYGSGYGTKYPQRSNYGSSYSSNLVLYPHSYRPQPSILSHLLPGRRYTYSNSRSGYQDEVRLKVEICCVECRTKMVNALRKMSGVYDVRVEGSVHTMVTVMGSDLKPKKILKKVRKIIRAADYWSDWHYSDGVGPYQGFNAPSSYSPSPSLRHMTY